jgi:glucose-1-phosphate cytidylyltransferase
MINTVILAGGHGSRISEETINKPKPLIHIGQNPIIWHLIKHFTKYGHKNFMIAGGYKIEMLKDYFFNLNKLNDDFDINYKTGLVNNFSKKNLDWKVGVYNTGLHSQTGSRLKKLESYLNLKNKNDFFLMTYGDGLCDVNINNLIKFHKKNGKIATVTAVRPPARFGYLQIVNGKVKNFKEKKQSNEGWINGGFFVLSRDIFRYLSIDDSCVFENEPLENLSKDGELMAYEHEGFWQCMDTKRDHDYLQNLNLKRLEYFND